jgi:hypothetical protein
MKSLLLGRSSSLEAPQVVLKNPHGEERGRAARLEPWPRAHSQRTARRYRIGGAIRFAIAPYAPDNENSPPLICPMGNRMNYLFRMPVRSPLLEPENRIREKPIC